MIVSVGRLIEGINQEGLRDLAIADFPRPKIDILNMGESETMPIPSAIVSETVYREYSCLFEKAFRRFNGQIVVDIGAGQFSFSYRIVEASGARAHVCVESHHFNMLKKALDDPVKSLDGKDRMIPPAILANDMLHVLRAIPNRAVSILAFGIDESIICSEEYTENMNKEIERVLHPDGAFICDYQCAIRPKNLFREECKPLYIYH